MLLCAVSNVEVLFCHHKLSDLSIYAVRLQFYVFVAVLCQLYLKDKDIILPKKRLLIGMLFMQLLHNEASNCL